MAEALSAGSAFRMGVLAPAGSGGHPRDGGDAHQSAFPPDVWAVTGADEEHDDDGDVDEEEQDDGYSAWALTDDAGQDLAGLSAPMFDVVVADDVGDPDCFYSAG